MKYLIIYNNKIIDSTNSLTYAREICRAYGSKCRILINNINDKSYLQPIFIKN